MLPTDLVANELLAHREHLDELNLQLLRLLEARGHVVAAVMALKHAHGLSPYDPQREESMLNQLCEHSRGLYTSGQIVKVFTSILEVSRTLGRARA